jgi:FRG domain
LPLSVDWSPSRLDLWRTVCLRYRVGEDSVPVFECDEQGYVLTKEIGEHTASKRFCRAASPWLISGHSVEIAHDCTPIQTSNENSRPFRGDEAAWQKGQRPRVNSNRNDWDVLFAMQHYGTPARLLDWTEVLGVAVYFATLGVDEANPDGGPPPCVWVLNPYALNAASVGAESDSENREAMDLIAPKNLGWDQAEWEYYTYSELLAENEIGWDWPRAIYPGSEIHGYTHNGLGSRSMATSFVQCRCTRTVHS